MTKNASTTIAFMQLHKKSQEKLTIQLKYLTIIPYSAHKADWQFLHSPPIISFTSYLLAGRHHCQTLQYSPLDDSNSSRKVSLPNSAGMNQALYEGRVEDLREKFLVLLAIRTIKYGRYILREHTI